MLWGSAVIDDIANHYAKKQEEHRKACEEMNKPFGEGLSSSNINLKRQIDRYKKEVFNYQTQIANYKLALSNDTEVMYKLIIHRNIFEVASKTFLEKVDDKTKQLFLDTLNEVKEKRENSDKYKEHWWRYTNQSNFSYNALWETQNPDKIDYVPFLYFPDVT